MFGLNLGLSRLFYVLPFSLNSSSVDHRYSFLSCPELHFTFSDRFNVVFATNSRSSMSRKGVYIHTHKTSSATSQENTNRERRRQKPV